MTDRDELERRLLALVRAYLDEADERHPDGYEVEDFTVIYQVRIAPSADEPLRAWDGGQQPGWFLDVSSSTSVRTWWQEEALLNTVLSRLRDDQIAEKYDLDTGQVEDADGEP